VEEKDKLLVRTKHYCQVSLLNLDFEAVLLDNIYSILSPKFRPFWV
jgi:hypothetical protein